MNVKLISGEPGAHQKAETFKMFSLELNFDIVKSQKWKQSLERIKDSQKVHIFNWLEIESESESEAWSASEGLRQQIWIWRPQF